ncbi:MAG: hypothetical protein JO159_12050 [Acidobacteria bacterium]|nr:hypothetical protein [Acidobacteriota bacterium]
MRVVDGSLATMTAGDLHGDGVSGEEVHQPGKQDHDGNNYQADNEQVFNHCLTRFVFRVAKYR